MILRPERWSDVWDAVEAEFTESTERGLSVVFSVHEVETVCAVKMLLAGFKARDVPCNFYPVENYSDLRSTLGRLLAGSTEFRTVFLINCGAGQYVRELAPPDCSDVRFVVVDSHRPIDHRYNNQSDEETFLLLAADDPQQLDGIPAVDALWDGMSEEDKAALVQEAQEEHEAEEAAELGDSPAKRARGPDGQPTAGGVGHAARDNLARLRAREAALADYLDMGSSYGKPSPLLLLQLAEMLANRTDNSLLWPAVVGLTDQWVHQRLSSSDYEAWYRQLKSQVTANDTNWEHQQAAAGDDPGRQANPQSQARIQAARDYRLMLLTHWTLYDAFRFSSYVAPRMQTWRRCGEDALALLLAHMGISKDQAQTAWSSMQSEPRRSFERLLPGALGATQLAYAELACEGFKLLHSRKVTAASDVVHACTALLSEHALAELPGQGQSASGFWAAAEAVDAHTVGGWRQLERGIAMAKAMQQAIIRDGGLMVTDRKLVVNMAAHMQELNLTTSPPTNAAEFRHPLTLLRLAQFVRDATKVARQASSHRTFTFPILVVGPEDGRGFCLTIGLRANARKEGAQWNVFGRTFKAVLEDPESETQWDGSREAFDPAVVHVHRSSVANFCADIRSALRQAALEAEDAARRVAAQEAARAAGAGGGAAAGSDAAAGSVGGAAAKQQQQQQEQQQEQQQRSRHKAGGDAAAAAAGSDDAEHMQLDQGMQAAGGSEAEPSEAGLPASPGGSSQGGDAAELEELAMVAASDSEGGGGSGIRR